MYRFYKNLLLLQSLQLLQPPIVVVAVTLATLTSIRGDGVIIPGDRAQYQFEYGVASPETGDIKAQRELRAGQNVLGEYALREADGTTRLVSYRSSPGTGLEAVVQRAGVAIHPPQALVGGQQFGGVQFGGQGFAGQQFGGQAAIGVQGLIGGQGFGIQGFGGQQLGGQLLGGQGIGLGLGGQGQGGLGLGGQGLGGLGLGGSFVGTTGWSNQGFGKLH